MLEYSFELIYVSVLTSFVCFLLQEKVRLRYKLTFDLGEESYDESGDIEQFPPPESWGNL